MGIKYNAEMLLKRLWRVVRDLIDAMGRLEILWKLVTLTKGGQIVLAFAVAAAAFAFEALRSDRLAFAFIIALSLFALIAFIAHFRYRLSSRPRLEYMGITGVQYELGDPKFGTEEGGFMYGASILRPLYARIANAQKDTDVAANNVAARIRYRHYDGRDEATAEAVWSAVVHKRGEFVERVHIESGEVAHLVVLYTYPPTGNRGAPGAKTTNDFLATGNLFAGGQFKKFGVGHRSVLIEMRSDNGAPLVLRGGFTVTKNEGLELDKPALRKLFAWE